MSSVVSPPAPRHSIRGVLLLGLLFFAPLLLAWALYFGSGWRPAGHTNHGALIDPPRPLSAGAFRGKWSLVYVGAGDCDASCRQALYFMRQTYFGLGELSPRVQRLFLTPSRCCQGDLEGAYPGLQVLDESGTDGTALLAAFPTDARATTLFIVDPRGNLMMRYDSRAVPKGLLQDLQHLLRLSSIG